MVTEWTRIHEAQKKIPEQRLVIEHWGDIPQEFREHLGLKPGLVQV